MIIYPDLKTTYCAGRWVFLWVRLLCVCLLAFHLKTAFSKVLNYIGQPSLYRLITNPIFKIINEKKKILKENSYRHSSHDSGVRELSVACVINYICSVKNWEKYLLSTGPMYKLLLSFAVNSYLTGPLFQIKLHLLSTVLLNGFQSSPGALKSTE